MWLVRNNDILDHLAALSRDKASATVNAVGAVEEGRIELDGTQRLHFAPAQARTTQPANGSRVRVDYNHAGDGYRFYSRLASLEPDGSWILTLPRTVERRDSRRVPRYFADRFGWAAFRVREVGGEPLLAVHDVSVDGVGLVYDLRTPPPAPGDILAGLLQVAGLPEMAVQVEVRNVRPGNAASTFIAGSRFVRIAVADRLRLDWFLARHGGERAAG
jgi:hypothetical protein